MAVFIVAHVSRVPSNCVICDAHEKKQSLDQRVFARLVHMNTQCRGTNDVRWLPRAVSGSTVPLCNRFLPSQWPF